MLQSAQLALMQLLLLTPATAPCPCSRPPTFCSALREQVLAQVEGAAPVSGEDGVYRGMNAYKDYRAGFRREHTIGGWAIWATKRCLFSCKLPQRCCGAVSDASCACCSSLTVCAPR